MVIVYIAIAMLPFLGGCSWFEKPAEPLIESVSLSEEPIQPIPVETIAQDVSAPAIVQTEVNANTTDIPKKENRRRRRRRKKKTIQETRHCATIEPNIVEQPTQLSKTIADLAQEPEQYVKKTVPSLFDCLNPQRTLTDKNTTESSSAPLPTQSSSITVHSMIDTEMLTVKHWTGTYVPTLLTLTINGHTVDIIEDKKVVIPDNFVITAPDGIIHADYKYEFMNGMRKGDGSETYKVHPGTQTLNLMFDWKTKWHIEFDKATPQE